MLNVGSNYCSTPTKITQSFKNLSCRCDHVGHTKNETQSKTQTNYKISNAYALARNSNITANSEFPPSFR